MLTVSSNAYYSSNVYYIKQCFTIYFIFQWQLSDGRYGSSIKPKPVKYIAVIGGGTMGSGIVVVALTAGFSVVLVEVNEKVKTYEIIIRNKIIYEI